MELKEMKTASRTLKSSRRKQNTITLRGLINARLNLAGFIFGNLANILKNILHKKFFETQFAKINHAKYFIYGDSQKKVSQKLP